MRFGVHVLGFSKLREEVSGGDCVYFVCIAKDSDEAVFLMLMWCQTLNIDYWILSTLKWAKRGSMVPVQEARSALC